MVTNSTNPEGIIGVSWSVVWAATCHSNQLLMYTSTSIAHQYVAIESAVLRLSLTVNYHCDKIPLTAFTQNTY